jgi:hypothetical protein
MRFILADTYPDRELAYLLSNSLPVKHHFFQVDNETVSRAKDYPGVAECVRAFTS